MPAYEYLGRVSENIRIGRQARLFKLYLPVADSKLNITKALRLA